MTVGIFGESYCTLNRFKPSHKITWMNFLGRPSSVFARGGASLLSIYWWFEQHHKSYDQIIFSVPDYLRADHTGNIIGYGVAEQILSDRSVSQEQYDRAKVFYDYYLHLQNDEVDDLYGTIILENVKRMRPDTIFIPMSKRQTFRPGTTCFEDFLDLQTRSLFPDRPDLRLWQEYKELDYLSNHYSPEINQLIARYVVRALDGEGWQEWNIDKIPSIPHDKPWDFYFEKIKK
jgi:hypothetical protein